MHPYLSTNQKVAFDLFAPQNHAVNKQKRAKMISSTRNDYTVKKTISIKDQYKAPVPQNILAASANRRIKGKSHSTQKANNRSHMKIYASPSRQQIDP